MSDTPKVGPAMSAHEWRVFESNGRDQLMPRYFAHCDHPSFIAKHNAALPDDDPRKITRERIDLLRYAVIQCGAEDPDDEATAELHRFADALASYLPAESP